MNEAERITADRHRPHNVLLTASPRKGRHWTSTSVCLSVCLSDSLSHACVLRRIAAPPVVTLFFATL